MRWEVPARFVERKILCEGFDLSASSNYVYLLSIYLDTKITDRKNRLSLFSQSADFRLYSLIYLASRDLWIE